MDRKDAVCSIGRKDVRIAEFNVVGDDAQLRCRARDVRIIRIPRGVVGTHAVVIERRRLKTGIEIRNNSRPHRRDLGPRTRGGVRPLNLESRFVGGIVGPAQLDLGGRRRCRHKIGRSGWRLSGGLGLASTVEPYPLTSGVGRRLDPQRSNDEDRRCDTPNSPRTREPVEMDGRLETR